MNPDLSAARTASGAGLPKALALEEVFAGSLSERERGRIADLLSRVPSHGCSVLDVGARDGRISRLLTSRFERVVALDLEQPVIPSDEPIECVAGNAAALQFADEAFECVVCTEVLEHIPPPELVRVGAELQRVAARTIVIGVPYRQDLRCGTSLCAACGKRNPPWGHVNSFDERTLQALFPHAKAVDISYVDTQADITNAVSSALMNYAGNPYGTYEQAEPCIHCGSPLGRPRARSPLERVATRMATLLDRAQSRFSAPRARWMHVRFEKHPAA